MADRAHETPKTLHLLYRYDLREDINEWRNPVVRWLVQQYRLLFYTARGLGRARNAGPLRSAHLLHAHVARAAPGPGLRRGQGDSASPTDSSKTSTSSSPNTPKPSTTSSDSPKTPWPEPRAASWPPWSGDALLGRDPRLRVDRKRLQQHLGGQGRTKHRPSVDRLHRRGDDRPRALDPRQCRRQLHRAGPGPLRQVVLHDPSPAWPRWSSSGRCSPCST